MDRGGIQKKNNFSRFSRSGEMSCWKLRERERVELLICHMCGAKRRNEEASSLIFFLEERDPTTNDGMQNGRSVGIYAHCIRVFARLAPIFMIRRGL